jgi:energy-coupling factor transporter transmembrane protein EcfT
LAGLHPATRLGLLAPALAVALVAPWPVVAAQALLLAAVVAAGGLGARAQWRLLRPWLPMALLALAVHTLTTTSAAPLGHPSWSGLAAGGRALLRLVASLAALGAWLRSGSLEEMVTGVAWWLAPLRRAGLAPADLGLAVAVACGTVPQVLGEGRRLRAVDDLRRHAAGARRNRWRWPWLDRARLVAPLLETLARRAEALEPALRGRRPAIAGTGQPRATEWLLLATGLAVAAAAIMLRGGR